MGWNETRPNATTDRVLDIPGINLSNYDAIEDGFGVEHYTFTDASSGLHKAGISGLVFYGTQAQIAALTGMASGAMAYDTTYGVWRRYSGTAWPILWAQWSRVRAYRSVSTTEIVCGADPATVVFNTEDYDTLSEYSNTTGIFTASGAGTYLATARVALVASGDVRVSDFTVYIYKNGAELVRSSRSIYENNVASGMRLGNSVLTTVSLAAADTLKVCVSKTMTSDWVYGDTAYTAFCIHRISGRGF